MENRCAQFEIAAYDKKSALRAVHKWIDGWNERNPYLNSNPLEKKETLGEQWKVFDWDTYENPDGNIAEIWYMNDRLSHLADELLDIIAPFVKEGSFIEMGGEDGAVWRWFFDGEKCCEYDAKIVFPGMPTKTERANIGGPSYIINCVCDHKTYSILFDHQLSDEELDEFTDSVMSYIEDNSINQRNPGYSHVHVDKDHLFKVVRPMRTIII